MTSQPRAADLTKLNLHSIFGEKSPQKRLRTITEIWVESGDAFFVEPTGVFKTHAAISDMAGRIQSLGGLEIVFIELGDVECLKHDEETDTWVTRLNWGVGTSKEDLKVIGWDVLTIVEGRIKACYTFLDGK